MDMYWPADTQLVSNVAREAKRVAHPWFRCFSALGSRYVHTHFLYQNAFRSFSLITFGFEFFRQKLLIKWNWLQGQFHQSMWLFCANKMRSFFWQMTLGKSELICRISPFILGKFHRQRMLVKLNSNFFRNTVCHQLFAWLTKVGEIDPRWSSLFEVSTIRRSENRGKVLIVWKIS